MSRPRRWFNVSVDLIITQFVQRGADDLISDFTRIGRGADTVEQKLENMGHLGVRLAGTGAAMGAGIGLFGKAVLEAGGNMQRIEAGFTAMLGSPEAAKAKIKEIQDFAARSPFDFVQSAKAGQELLAMGMDAKDLIPTMNAVGNAVAAAGKGSAEFNGVLRALGQIKTKGKLSQEELNQMSERGVDLKSVMAALQAELGLTASQMMDVGNAGISAEKALPIITKALAGVGGGKGMEEQLKTLPGQISMVGDAWNQFLVATAKPIMGDAGEAAKALTGLLERMTKFNEAHPGLVKTGLALGAMASGGMVAYGAYLKLQGALGLAKLAKVDLKNATIADDLAEKAKIGTAKREAEAFGTVSKMAGGAADDVDKLGKVTKFFAASAFGLEGAAAVAVGAGAVAATAWAINDISNSAADIGLSDKDYANKRGLRGQTELDAARGLSDNAFARWWRGDNAANDAEREAMRLTGLNRQRDLNKRRGIQDTPASPYVGMMAPPPPPDPTVVARLTRANRARVEVQVSVPHGAGDHAANDRNATRLAGG
jgi:tape measure domain-containing protein